MRSAVGLFLVIFSISKGSMIADVMVKVPAGRELKATLQGATTTARIQGAPRIVEFQFGWKDASGQFRQYAGTEPIIYTREFVVRTRYDTEPQFAKTTITLSWEGGKREVPMFRTRANPRIFESSELSFPSMEGCKGLTVCQPQEDWGHENFPY